MTIMAKANQAPASFTIPIVLEDAKGGADFVMQGGCRHCEKGTPDGAIQY